MLMGYGRMSTVDQNPAPQEDALRAAGCEKLFIENGACPFCSPLMNTIAPGSLAVTFTEATAGCRATGPST